MFGHFTVPKNIISTHRALCISDVTAELNRMPSALSALAIKGAWVALTNEGDSDEAGAYRDGHGPLWRLRYLMR